MKRIVKMAIFAAIGISVTIGGLALFVHSKLSDIEKNETRKESAEQIAKEAQDVLSGKEPHSGLDETSHLEEKTKANSEEGESAEQRERELP